MDAWRGLIRQIVSLDSWSFVTNNKTNPLHVSVASVRDRDELVAELWASVAQVAELAKMGHQLVL
jgi:hypothetical protein